MSKLTAKMQKKIQELDREMERLRDQHRLDRAIQNEMWAYENWSFWHCIPTTREAMIAMKIKKLSWYNPENGYVLLNRAFESGLYDNEELYACIPVHLRVQYREWTETL